MKCKFRHMCVDAGGRDLGFETAEEVVTGFLGGL